jgi:hypothetical protein
LEGEELAMKKDYLLLAVLAVISFFILALAWPLASGRDGYSYLYYAYDFLNPNPETPFTMMFRTPVAPFFNWFLLEFLGPILSEVLMGLFFVSTILVIYRIGYYWERKVGLLLACLALLHIGWGSLFHVISNDPPLAIIIPFLLWQVIAAAETGKLNKFFLCGMLTGILSLTRPGIFTVLGIFPLFLPNWLWRKRLLGSAIFFVGCLPFLVGWGIWNKGRYGHFTVTPGADVILPLARVLAVDQSLREENGPNSRLLADAVRTYLIKNKPELRGWTADRYFQEHLSYFDYMVLSDKAWGKGKYAIIKGAAREAVFAQPLKYFSGAGKTFILTLAGNLKEPVPLPGGIRVYTHKHHVTYIAHGVDQWVPISNFNFLNPPLDNNMQAVVAKEGPLSLRAWNVFAKLPLRAGLVSLGSLLNWSCYLFPPMLLWVLAGFTLWPLSWRSFQAKDFSLLYFALLCLCTNAMASLSIWTVVYEYRLPFDPVYILIGLLPILKLRMKRKLIF